MRQTIIKWALLFLVIACIAVGVLILIATPEYDPRHAFDTWSGIGLSALLIVLGVWLGYKLDKCNLLPE